MVRRPMPVGETLSITVDPLKAKNVGNVVHSLKDGRGLYFHNQAYVWSDRDNRLFTDENPQRVDPNWVMDDFTVYKADMGMYVRGLGGVISNVKMADVLDGSRFRLMTEIRNSLIVGRN